MVEQPTRTGDGPIVLRQPGVFGGAVAAGFSTRHGGLSTGAFSSLNLGLSTPDLGDLVRGNRDLLFGILGKTRSDIAVAGQVHGSAVAVAAAPGLYPNTDGLVSSTRGLPLAITVADCAVVLLADEQAGVVGACHAGWRGAEGRICTNTVVRMDELGADPGRLFAYVSPCISAEAFEVGEEVATRFRDHLVVRRPEWPRPHIDLKRAIRDELVDCGVPSAAIEVSNECTFGHPDYFSHRSSGGRTGRMMGFIMLK